MILSALCDYYNRSEDLPPFGFEDKEIAFLVVIDIDGNFLRIEDRRKDKYRSKKFRVIRGASNKTSGVVPNVLWDKVDYILNYNDKKGIIPDELSERTKAEIEIIKKLVANYPSNIKFKAVLNFYEKKQMKLVQKDTLWTEIIQKKGHISFLINGDTEIVASQCIELEDYVKSIYNDCKNGTCLVTGNKGKIAKTTFITTVLNATNGKLVAFQTDSGYDSYGKKKCDNAPISIESEFSYTTALLKLLEYDSRNKFKINNRIFLFWSSSKETKEFEKEFYNFFNCTDNVVDDPDFHIDLVRKTFKSISTGTPNKLQNDKFYFLGLAPNGKARVAVVYWLEGSLVEFSKYISRYFDDMDIIDKRQIKKNYMGVYQVLRSITLNDDMSKLAPNISETLIKSIMEGTLYPYSLFVACINRIRANQNTPSKNKKKDYYSFLANEISRIAFIKAYLIRNNNDKINVMIDKNNTNQGYLCGRLFATLEYIQERGNGTSTIRSRYMNSASSTPSAVFPTLLNLSIHHSEKLKKDAQIFFELIKTEIIDKITSDGFPSHLNLQDQGRFMVGYYHQRQEFYTPNTKSEKDEIINVEQ